MSQRFADIEEAASAALKELLETCVLYQSVSVVPLPETNQEPTRNLHRLLTQELWRFRSPNVSGGDEIDVVSARIKVPCCDCRRDEPFKLQAAQELGLWGTPRKTSTKGDALQNIALGYACQSCDSYVAFLVRREGTRLTLTGRSPLLRVQLPSFLPELDKPHRHYVSDAVVAHRAGQTLAGLFLLRTYIEQVCRTLTQHTGETDVAKADQVIDEYMKGLPDEVRGVFPSLRAIYGDLSDAIHRARPSGELFDLALEDIKRHFEGREITLAALERKKRRAPSAPPIPPT